MLTRSDIVCEAEPFVTGDSRIEKVLRSVEDALPGTSVDHVILSSRYKWERTSDRVRLVNERAFDETSKDFLTTIFGNGKRNDDAVTVTLGRSSKGGVGRVRKTWTIRVSISNEKESTVSRLPALLRAICESADAINGWGGTFSSLAQFNSAANNSKRPIAATMADGFRFDLPLSWLNYWSDAVAQSLNFPDPDLDACLGGLYANISDRGWVLRLTNELLDLRNPEHLKRLTWAYGRFGMT